MKRPKVVKVLDFLIEINWSKSKCDDHMLKEAEKVFGYFVFENLEIVVSPDIPKAIQQETLLHELTHVAYVIVNAAIDSPTEEQYITIGTPILLATLKDPVNKDVFDFIFGE